MKKTIFFLLTSLILAGCNTSSHSNETTTLLPSEHPYDAWRFTNSDTNGIICIENYCNKYAQASLINKYPKIFQDIGPDSVQITFYNGTVKKYVPSERVDDYCDVCGYSAVIEYPKIHSVLLHRSFYEGDDYLLINLKTGAETPVANPPIFSPDYQYFLSIDSEVNAAYNQGQLKIFKIDDQGQIHFILEALNPKYIPLPIQQEDYINTGSAGITYGKWINNNQFIVVAEFYKSNQYDMDEMSIDHRYFEFNLTQSAHDPQATRWISKPISSEYADKFTKLVN